MGPPLSSMFCIDLYWETVKISLSKTTLPRALMFGMKRYVVELYQVCSNYAPWAKNESALGVTCSA